MLPTNHKIGPSVDAGWQATVISAVTAYRESDPQDWAECVSAAEDLTRGEAQISGAWEEVRLT